MRNYSSPAIVLLLALTAAGSAAQELRISTQNDIVAHSRTPDDLYTFSEAFDIQRQGYHASLRENAFTDRTAGTRFDETYLSLGRPLPAPEPWDLEGELGIVHVGHGLFGQDTQNAVHRALGCDPIHLRYLPASVHPRLAFSARRHGTLGRTVTLGPSLDVDLVPGLRSWALIAAQAAWEATSGVAVEALAGARFTTASFAPLVPHLAASAPAGSVGVVLAGRLFVSWSYNDFGDRREHVTAGYRLPVGGSARGLRRAGRP